MKPEWLLVTNRPTRHTIGLVRRSGAGPNCSFRATGPVLPPRLRSTSRRRDSEVNNQFDSLAVLPWTLVVPLALERPLDAREQRRSNSIKRLINCIGGS